MNKLNLITLSILFVLLLPRHGYAQHEDERSTSLWGGVALAGGLFKFAGEGIESPQTSGGVKSAFTAGGQLGYAPHPRFALHAEVLFAMKGSYHLLDGRRIGSYTLNYLELPLLARVSLPPIQDMLLPFVAAGPWVGFLLSATGKDLRQGEPLNLDGVYKTTDFGVIFAAGAAVRITPYDLVGLEFRYDMGLRAIQPERDTINNRGMLLVLRYETCICSRSAAR
jgi:hypothetical protein